MLKEVNFTIKSRPELPLKFTNLSATQVLSFNTLIDYETFEQSEKSFSFVFEHTMVKINNEWLPLKEKDMEVYYPIDIEEDLHSLQEIFMAFVNNVLKPLFTKSKESSQKQQ